MSFGIGVGDILAVLKLVKDTRKQFIEAPAECNVLAKDARQRDVVLAIERLTIHQHDVGLAVEKLTVKLDSEAHQRALDWLDPGDQANHQNDILARVQLGTGQWILIDPVFLEWFRATGPATLLLPGIPGAGKTFIASVVIDHLQKMASSNGTAGLAFFYNSFGRSATQSRLDIISSLARQLSSQHAQNIDVVKKLYQEHQTSKPATRPSLEEIFLIFEEMLPRFKTVFIVIDALDEGQGPEAPENIPWRDILTFLFRMVVQFKARVSIKIVATSRPNLDFEIDDLFSGGKQLPIYATADDLGRYCDALIPNLSKCIARKQDLHSHIRKAICESAKGMFLLAKLHCDALATKTKPKDILLALESFNQGGDALDRAYQDTMQRIWSQPKEHVELATKVLVCVTHAARPLRLKEVQYAIAVGEETQVLDPEYDLDDPDDMLTSCAGLVRVDAESMTMRLAHYTTQTFLESLGDSLMSNPHDLLASSCLNYLHMDPFSEGHMDEYQEFPFLQYSAKFWDWHLSTGSGAAALKQQAMTFLDSVGRVMTTLEASHYCSLYPLEEPEDALIPHGFCGLHLLAYKGLDTWVDQYIIHRTTAISEISCCTPCCMCRDTVVDNIELLVRKKPSWSKILTSWRGIDGYLPLNCAIEAGHTTTAEVLLDLNAEVLNEEYVGDRLTLDPVLCALRSENEALALTMLKHPGMNLWKHYHRPPRGWIEIYLRAAVDYEIWAVVNLMLDLASALPMTERNQVREHFKAKDERGETLLHAVAKIDNPAIRERLLALAGLDGLNARDEIGRTPLHFAAEHGSFETLSLLLAQPTIQTDLRDKDGCSALHAAIDHPRKSNVNMLTYLLETGLFPADSTNLKGQSVLFRAVQYGKDEAVLLLAPREDVDVDRADLNGTTVLMLAAGRMATDMITYLAPLSRDVDLADAKGTTALMLAAGCIDIDMVACLCPLSRNIDLADAKGRTVLHHFAESKIFHRPSKDFRPFLLLLLKAGASPEKTNNANETPSDVLIRRVRKKKSKQNRDMWAWRKSERERRMLVLKEARSLMESYMPKSA